MRPSPTSRLFSQLAIAVALISSMLLVGPAVAQADHSAGPTVVTAPGDTGTLSGYPCRVANLRNDTVNVRFDPNITSRVIYQLYPGYSLPSKCYYLRHSYSPNNWYSCFGHPRDNTWVTVSVPGHLIGFVGWRCVTGPYAP